MQKNILTKKNFYLLSVLVGFILVITGIYLFAEALKQPDTQKTGTRAAVLLVWTGFTIYNIFLVKAEIRKTKIRKP